MRKFWVPYRDLVSQDTCLMRKCFPSTVVFPSCCSVGSWVTAKRFSALKFLHFWCAVSLHPASLTGMLQIWAGVSAVCPAGTQCVANLYHLLFAEFPHCRLWEYKIFFLFHNTPWILVIRNCLRITGCNQNLAAFVICISDERVCWAHSVSGSVLGSSHENEAQGTQVLWWCSGLCVCVFAWVMGDRYVLITCAQPR